jgi:hypothetical protein
VLKEGWTFKQEAERFKVMPPLASLNDQDFSEKLRSEVWRLAEFVAYANFISISQVPAGYVIVSKMASGNGFEILIEAMATSSG